MANRGSTIAAQVLCLSSARPGERRPGLIAALKDPGPREIIVNSLLGLVLSRREHFRGTGSPFA